jgi:hypothetical protein
MRMTAMRIAEIDWSMFWQALRQQQPAVKERWLRRWVFADDGVRLSLRPAQEKQRR